MRHTSLRTEEAHGHWIRRYILFHRKRHPAQMGPVLLYGAGLRLRECLELRVKDLDFERREIVVREGKGNTDRVTMLPAVVQQPLRGHLDRGRRLREADLAAGVGRVQLPDALARKYPTANREWGWQWVFPASMMYTHVPNWGGRGVVSPAGRL